QVAGHAVKERVAAGHDYQALTAEVVFEQAHGRLKIVADGETFGPGLGHQVEGVVRAKEQVGPQEQVAGAGGQAGQPVAADAYNVNLGFGCGHGGSSSVAMWGAGL